MFSFYLIHFILSASLPTTQTNAGTLGRRNTSSRVMAMARNIDKTTGSPSQEARDKDSKENNANKETKPTENKDKEDAPIPPPPVPVTTRNRNYTISTVTYQVGPPSGGADSLTKLFSPPTPSPTISSPPSNPSSPTSPASPQGDLSSSGEGIGGSARRFFTLRRGGGAAQSPPQSDPNTEYENYLAIAKKEEFNDVAPLNFMYPSGNASPLLLLCVINMV
jgi:hypothetical protein